MQQASTSLLKWCFPKTAQNVFWNIPLDKMIGRTVIYDDSVRNNCIRYCQGWIKILILVFTDFISVQHSSKSILKNQIPTADWSSLGPPPGDAFVKIVQRNNRCFRSMKGSQHSSKKKWVKLNSDGN